MSSLIMDLANKKYGLGRMWRYIRAMKRYQNQSDLGIFRLTVETLKKNGHRISNKSVSYHFDRNVDKEDFENDGSVRKEVLRDMFDL